MFSYAFCWAVISSSDLSDRPERRLPVLFSVALFDTPSIDRPFPGPDEITSCNDDAFKFSFFKFVRLELIISVSSLNFLIWLILTLLML